MDFRNVPNTSNYTEAAAPVDGNGGISSGAISQNAYVAATLQEDEPKKTSASKWILIAVIGLFALVSIGSIGFYFFSNSQQASANNNDTPPQPIMVVATVPPYTPIPTPTYLLPTIAASPTLGPGETLVPTMPTPVVWFTEVPTPSALPRRFSWEISFEKQSYTSAEVSNRSRPEFTGVMRSPLSKNATICFTDDQKFFALKKDSASLGRLCDEYTPTPAQRTLNCYKYNPDTGIEVKASLHPNINCNSSNSPVQSGTYVMAARVYYNCSLPGGDMRGIPVSSCTDTREVFSYDLIYTR